MAKLAMLVFMPFTGIKLPSQQLVTAEVLLFFAFEHKLTTELLVVSCTCQLFCFSLNPSSDGSGGRKHPSEKENGVNQVPDKGVGLSSLPTSQESKNKEVLPSTSPQSVITNGPLDVAPGSMGVVRAHLSPVSLDNQPGEGSSTDMSKLNGPPPPPHPVSMMEKPPIDFVTGDAHGHLTSSSSSNSIAGTQATLPGVYFSASNPVLVILGFPEL
ncbi:uncharacterized protein LOC131328457 [Rhododendron vialii]|uniref:uncharacterized protein LOC131328457 n=1 Tax=Rhododendron vialii TaxID=182163 RepID=UPI00265E2919|nr:uncharacterized protein LOC131328457 [Rhododendron vialii]